MEIDWKTCMAKWPIWKIALQQNANFCVNIAINLAPLFNLLRRYFLLLGPWYEFILQPPGYSDATRCVL